VTVTNLPKKIRFSRKRKAKITFTAGPVGLDGTVGVVTSKQGRRKAFAVAARTFSVPAGGQVTVKLKASRKAARKLRKRSSFPGTLGVVLDGQPFAADIRVSIKRKRG
jgi:hypothetical protein